MTQGSLPITRAGQYSQRLATGDAGIVAIDRFGEQELILKFLSKDQWGQPAKEVHLDMRLAEQLKRLLEEELEDG
jgi:hypothetical protein